MSSTYWKREIRRYSDWIRDAFDNPKSILGFDESIGRIEFAINKYKKWKKHEAIKSTKNKEGGFSGFNTG